MVRSVEGAHNSNFEQPAKPHDEAWRSLAISPRVFQTFMFRGLLVLFALECCALGLILGSQFSKPSSHDPVVDLAAIVKPSALSIEVGKSKDLQPASSDVKKLRLKPNRELLGTGETTLGRGFLDKSGNYLSSLDTWSSKSHPPLQEPHAVPQKRSSMFLISAKLNEVPEGEHGSIPTSAERVAIDEEGVGLDKVLSKEGPDEKPLDSTSPPESGESPSAPQPEIDAPEQAKEEDVVEEQGAIKEESAPETSIDNAGEGAGEDSGLALSEEELAPQEPQVEVLDSADAPSADVPLPEMEQASEDGSSGSNGGSDLLPQKDIPTEGKAMLRGIVFGPDGNALGGVGVSIPAIDRTTRTDEKGIFELANLPATELILKFSKIGYKVADRTVALREEGINEIEQNLEEQAVEFDDSGHMMDEVEVVGEYTEEDSSTEIVFDTEVDSQALVTGIGRAEFEKNWCERCGWRC